MRRNPLSFRHPFSRSLPASYRIERCGLWRDGTWMTLPPRSRYPSPRRPPACPVRSALSRPRGSTAGMDGRGPLCHGAPTMGASSCAYGSLSVTIPHAHARCSPNACPPGRPRRRDGRGGWPRPCAPSASPLGAKRGPGSRPAGSGGPGLTPSSGWCGRPRPPPPPPRSRSAWTSGPSGGGTATARSS
jgi:hypothetical protein